MAEKKPTQGVQRRDLNAAERVRLALKLRAARMTYDQIAEQAGYDSRGSAYKAVQRELQRCVSKDVEHLRNEEMSMLDQMHTECWALFMDRKNMHRLYAADRLLSISEARRKLMGLDAHVDEIASGITIIREYGCEVGKV